MFDAALDCSRQSLSAPAYAMEQSHGQGFQASAVGSCARAFCSAEESLFDISGNVSR